MVIQRYGRLAAIQEGGFFDGYRGFNSFPSKSCTGGRSGQDGLWWTPSIFLENENGDAFPYYHTIYDN